MTDIAFQNCNLYLKGKGRDINGNSIIKLGWASGRGFSIQTNQRGLMETQKILRDVNRISQIKVGDLAKIEKQVCNYIKNYGSKLQKKKLRTY